MSNIRELSQLAASIVVGDSNRNIGIGTSTPASKLSVVGDANISGVVTASAFYGDGSQLTGIVTSITAGSGISIDQSTGNVTISGSVVGSIDDLSDVDTSSVAPSEGQTLLWDSVNSKWEPGTVSGLPSVNAIIPVALARVTTTSGSGVGVTWGNWNSGNSTLDFTFDVQQPDTNYAVITDSEQFDDRSVGISNKTTTGFRAEFYDSSNSRTPSTSDPYTFLIYGSDPRSNFAVAAGAAEIRDGGSTIGIATVIDFGSNLTVSNVSVGIVTVASSGGGIGINTSGGLVGFGVTYLHLYGAGISTTFYDSSVGIATIFIEGGGGGSGSISISKVSPYSPSSGDLWYSPDYGRTFIYYDESTVGYGSDAYWVDAAPFNVSNGGGASVSISTVAPTSPSSGDLWYNSNLGRTFIYYTDDDSSQWVDSSPFNYTGITTSTYTENSFTATAGQTVFNVTYDVGYLEVYLNGIRLSSSEYTATNGTSVTLNSAASGGDVVDIIEVTTNRGPAGPAGPQGPAVTIPGPYTDDSDAANNNVEVGSPYYRSTGLVYVRLT